jgi:hypothetical protein
MVTPDFSPQSNSVHNCATAENTPVLTAQKTTVPNLDAACNMASEQKILKPQPKRSIGGGFNIMNANGP